MLKKEENLRLTHVGPGHPMGELLRRYWHPIAASSQLKGRHTLQVNILGEELVLYRDREGRYGLIEPYCAHRRMSLLYGVPEQRGLRCAYHGWLYDETGKCLEQPYEETEDPEGSFKEKITIKAYPVEELGGLIFAYMGPKPVPLLPRWDLCVMEGVVRDIGYAVIPCNWLQIMENSLDPVHVEWLHQNFSNYVVERLNKPELQRPRQRHIKVGFDLFEYGIIKRRVLEGESEEDDDWKVGHPVVFPNMLRQGNPRQGGGRSGGFQIRVPIDDTHTAHWWYSCYPKRPEDEDQTPEGIPFYNVPLPKLDEQGEPRWELLDNNSGQDIAAWITQGPIADRTLETLGRSDKGIILYRRLLEEQMCIVERGGDPMNVFRDTTKNSYLHLPTEENFLAGAARSRPGRPRVGAATKYSPLLGTREHAGAQASSKGQ